MQEVNVILSETSAKTYEEVAASRIEDIMDEFDFDKVHKVMDSLDWTWVGVEAGDNIPSRAELRRSARRLLQQSVQTKSSIGSGGFRIEFDSGEENGMPWVNLNLFFCVESTSYDGEFYRRKS
jgi:predicted ThiF/HesA family dinucleotide-utilizing enzyme